MADFTENLPNASSSRRIIDPGKEGPSWFDGALGALSEGISRTSRLFDENETDARQRAASARQAATDEREARGRVAQDRLAGIMWQARDQYSEPGATPPLADNATDYPTYVPVDSSLEGLPTDERVVEAVEPRIDEMNRVRQAEEQGRAPRGSYRVLLERNVSALMAEMPDQQAEIFAALREAGFDHYLFREAETDQKLHEAGVTQEINQRNSLANAAVERGLVEVGTDPNTAAAVGQRALDQEYRTKLLREQAAAAQSGSAEARAQYQHSKTLADEEARRNFGANLSAVIQPRWNQLTNILTQANGSTEALNLLPDAIRGMDTIVENHIAAARQGGASEEVINTMRADWDNMKKSAYDFVSGPASEAGVAKTALDAMQSRLGLQLGQALPTYMALQEVFGATALAGLFGGDPTTALPQEVIDRARREVRGIDGAIDTDQERVSLAVTARILRGDLNINELTEAQARGQMPTLVTTIQGQAQEVARGSGNVNSLINGNLAVMNASMELQPGNSTVNSEQIAVSTLFNQQQRQALARIMREDPAQGELLANAGRASAMHVWQNLKNHRLNEQESMGGLWGIRLNEATNQFEPVLRRERYEAQAFRPGNPYNPGSAGTRLPFEQARTRPPAALTTLINAQNRVVGYLTETSQYDPRFQGVDNASARDFYIHGRIPPAMERRMETDSRTAATLQSQAQAFRSGLDEDRVASERVRDQAIQDRVVGQAPPPTTELQNQVKTAADQFGLPWDLVGRLVGKESGWNPGARNAITGASSLFQINDDIPRSLDENINQGLNMLKDAQESAQRILGERATNADAYVMYQQGAGGGAALLSPANATRKAVDVLTAVYGNERTARQAITANGGNLNMTASEFAQSIRDYFNR